MSTHRFSWKDKPRNPDNLPTVCVCRFGAYGDVAQAASILRQFKLQGYWVAFMCSYPSSEIVASDPHIDEFLVQMQNQVPPHWLGMYWHWIKNQWHSKGFDKWVNLSESAEVNLLAMDGNIRFEHPPALR